MSYTPPVPVTPAFGGTLIVPIYDAPYTLPVPVSQGGPVFAPNTLTPIVTWDTSGYWAVSLSNTNSTPTQNNAYFNAIQLFPESYSGSSCPSLVNSGSYGAHGNFTGSNGLLYCLASQLFGYAYCYQTTLLTPYGSNNRYGAEYFYLGATNLWRVPSSTTEQAVGTFTSISTTVNSAPFGLFQIAYQGSGTVSENDTYIGGVQLGQPPFPISAHYDLGPANSGLYGNNTSQTAENFKSMWYNQTAQNNYQGANLPQSKMPNVLLSAYGDGSTQGCYHLFGYNPAASYNSMLGQYQPAMTDIGAFLVPGITSVGSHSAPNAPTGLCGFGFFWQTSVNTGVVLAPEGTMYWDLIFVGQSANARAALSSGYTSIMGDGSGAFWLVTYTLSSNSFYVGNGLAQLLYAPTFQDITSYAIPLPCFSPCSFGNNLGG